MSNKNDLLQSLLDNIPDFVYIKDDQNRFVKVSKSMSELLETDPDEMIGKTEFDFFPEEQAKEMAEEDEKVMETGEPLRKEERVKTPASGESWISVIKAPRYDEEGNIIGTVAISRDIGERKEVINKLEESEEKYRAIFEHSGTNVIIQNGEFVEVNPEFIKLTGYSEGELIGMDSLEIVPREEREKVRENAIQMLKNKRTEPYEHRIKRKEEGMRWLLEKVTSVKYERKRATLASFIDITEIKKTEKRRDLFNSLLTHDLRNKVQIAKGYHKLLNKTNLSEEGEDYLKKASEAVKDADKLIERMSGKRKGETKEFEITEEEIEEVLEDNQT